MLSVGITGGIGSGKSTVCRLFEALGVPVYYADERSKFILNSDPEAIRQVKALLGDRAYLPDGKADRAWIASRVFNDPEMLQSLNRILHPLVFQDTLRWMSEQQAAYVLREAALLVETGMYKMLDKLIVVSAPEEERIARVMSRDHCSREEVLLRMKNQLPEEEKLRLADYVIENISPEQTQESVMKLHRQLLSLAHGQ
jgi:dephospho-CoA kinase